MTDTRDIDTDFDSEHRLRRAVRAGLSAVVVLGSAALGATLFGPALTKTTADATPSESSGAIAIVNGEEIPVVEGQVVGQLRMADGRCQFDTPFAVGGASRDNAPVYSIRWHLDEQCRIVITQIESVAPSDEDVLPPVVGSHREAEQR